MSDDERVEAIRERLETSMGHRNVAGHLETWTVQPHHAPLLHHSQADVCYLLDQLAAVTGAREEACAWRDETRDRLQTIVDEAWGMEPTTPADELMTLIEHRVFEDRKEAVRLRDERDTARAEGERLREALRALLAEARATDEDDNADTYDVYWRLRAGLSALAATKETP